MYKVKFTTADTSFNSIYHRQTAHHDLVSLDGRYLFLIDDTEEADFWVVQGKGIRAQQHCRVAPQNTIFLTTEPESILVYPKRFLRQFGLVCSCQEKIKHSNVLYGPAILPWYVGVKENGKPVDSFCLDYDNLKGTSCREQKKRLISVITSDKVFTQGHIDRIRFVRYLRDYFGNRLDVFGRGFRTFDDKWDVLAPYKYHISIENSSQKYYWTEKISDCFLAECFPFYYGCTNLSDYFPSESFLPINLCHPEKAIELIEGAIAKDRATQAAAALAESKRRVLEEYNMFEYVARLCDRLNPEAPKKDVCIQPCYSSDEPRNLLHYTFTRSYYKLKAKLLGAKL